MNHILVKDSIILFAPKQPASRSFTWNDIYRVLHPKGGGAQGKVPPIPIDAITHNDRRRRRKRSQKVRAEQNRALTGDIGSKCPEILRVISNKLSRKYRIGGAVNIPPLLHNSESDSNKDNEYYSMLRRLYMISLTTTTTMVMIIQTSGTSTPSIQDDHFLPHPGVITRWARR